MTRKNSVSLVIMLFINPIIIMVLFQNCTLLSPEMRQVASANAEEIDPANDPKKYFEPSTPNECHATKKPCHF